MIQENELDNSSDINKACDPKVKYLTENYIPKTKNPIEETDAALDELKEEVSQEEKSDVKSGKGKSQNVEEQKNSIPKGRRKNPHKKIQEIKESNGKINDSKIPTSGPKSSRKRMNSGYEILVEYNAAETEITIVKKSKQKEKLPAKELDPGMFEKLKGRQAKGKFTNTEMHIVLKDGLPISLIPRRLPIIDNQSVQLKEEKSILQMDLDASEQQIRSLERKLSVSKQTVEMLQKQLSEAKNKVEAAKFQRRTKDKILPEKENEVENVKLKMLEMLAFLREILNADDWEHYGDLWDAAAVPTPSSVTSIYKSTKLKARLYKRHKSFLEEPSVPKTRFPKAISVN
ncbi:uncharacterized protein LOC118192871, partial [Stegodyphus dumicola]|uniref:uncharacterized protein LOC118192871 n=1 Tax=Stegodyphus dumicola TaxID=202533 RepID=UPI0015AD6078